jgi:integrase
VPRRRNAPEPVPRRRRRRGTGAVDFHKPSQLWRARLPRQLHPSQQPAYFPTDAAAHAWLDAELDRLAQLAAGPHAAMSLRTYLSDWVVTTSSSADWSPATLRCRMSHLAYLASLDDRPLESITRADLQPLVAALLRGSKRRYKRPDGSEYRKPPRGSYVHNVVGSWRLAFAAAVEDGLLARNPCSKLVLPPGGSAPGPTWLPSEAAVLVPAIRGHRYEAVFALLFGCGLRIGEARALAWADVDVAGQRAFIHRTNDQRVGILDRVKGRVGKWVTLPAPVLDALERQRKLQPWAAVYVSEHAPGRTASYDVLVKQLKRLAAAAGVRVLSPHAARHAAGTALGARGVPLATIAHRLRHQNQRVTERYVHTEQLGEQLATEVLAGLFAGPAGGNEG